METVELAQGNVRYRVAGPETSSAPPVVLLHPVLTHGALWASVQEGLAQRGIRSYAPDLPLGSHTIALGPDADRSPSGVAQLVRDFLAALDLTDVTLVGNDTGGALTQYILDAGEPRVARAVLMNCDAFDKFPPFPFNIVLPMLASHDAVTRMAASQLGPKPLRHSWLGFGLLSKNLPPELTASWIEPVRTNAGVRRDVIEFIRNVKPAELDAITRRMSNVDVPITVLWGMSDKVFKPELGRRLAAAFPNAEFVEVPGARTLLALDAPDAVADAIEAIAKR
jgi:pimeloyl-ACP methyl ester carboxylesterase